MEGARIRSRYENAVNDTAGTLSASQITGAYEEQ